VQLKSVSESSLGSNNKCIIYADSELNDGEVITAYVAEDDYNILYHNADGTIAESFSSDDITNGLFTITSTDVPDDGYVTLEEISAPRGGDTASYMFSVQKSLLSDMVVNVLSEQDDTCLIGSDYREAASDETLVNVREESEDTSYYQSSYDVGSISGKTTSSDIPVDSPYPAEHDVLITAFDDYDSSTLQYTTLTNWSFIDSDNLYVDENDPGFGRIASFSDDGLTDIYWSSTDPVQLDSDSGIIAIHNNISYFWQPIYGNVELLTLAYGTSEVSLWSGYLSGTISANDWLFTSFTELDEDIYLYLDGFADVNALDGGSVSTVCDVADTYCIDTNSIYNSDDFDYQRVHFRLTEESSGDNLITFQSIYSITGEVVVLESGLFDYSNPTLTRIETNLMDSDASSSDAIQYLMLTNTNLVTVGEYSSSEDDNAAETDYYSDINALITNASETEDLYQAMLESKTTILSNAYEF